MLPLALTALLVYVLVYYWRVRKYPRGPFPLPLIGNLYHLRANTVHEYVHKVGKDYDHCFTLFLPRPVVFFTDYSTIKEALITQGDNFIGRSQLPPETYLQPEVQTGIAISDGAVWRENRRTALRILREHGMGKNLMEAQVNRSIDEMLDQLNLMNDGVASIDMSLPLQLCVGNVINETLFGYLFKHTDLSVFEFAFNTTSKHMQNVRDNIWVMLMQAWPWTKRLPIIGQKGYTEPMNNITKFHNFIRDETEKIAIAFDRRQEPTNFVESYLVEMEKNPHLDMANLNGIVVDFWIAGSETLSATLRWAVLLWMEYPEIQDRIRAELLCVVGRDRRIEMADKPSLPYFNAAITETQRWANILPFTQFHRCTSDTTIGGKLVPKDTLTLPQIHSLMRDERIFPNPEVFRPERFLDEDGKTTNKRSLDYFVAFGIGKRQCLGESLARMELFLVLGTLLLNYRFEKTGSIDLTPVFGSILSPRPYKCRIVPI